MVPWVQQGKVKYQETVLDGFHQLPKCMIGRGTQARGVTGACNAVVDMCLWLNGSSIAVCAGRALHWC